MLIFSQLKMVEVKEISALEEMNPWNEVVLTAGPLLTPHVIGYIIFEARGLLSGSTYFT